MHSIPLAKRSQVLYSIQLGRPSLTQRDKIKLMIKNFTALDVPEQSGKTFLITGANTGIGFETAKVLATRGARVLLGCRSPEKARVAQKQIQDTSPEADLEIVPIDLADLGSVKAAAEQVLQERRLDALINNAGVMWPPKMLTNDGFEYQFGINHLGHFALTGRLLKLLETTANSRIVTVSSLGHRKCVEGDLLLEDIQADRSYNPQDRYCASKLANLLFTYELDRRLRNKNSSTIAVAAHPGVSHSELFRYSRGVIGVIVNIMTFLTRPIINTAAQGAWSTQMGATAPGVQGGQYFGPSRFGEISGPAQQVDSSVESKDLGNAKRLWRFSIEKTGVDPGL